MKVFLEQLSHRWQSWGSTVLREPPHCGGLTLGKSKARAAKALAAAGVVAPRFPGLCFGNRWCPQAREGAWSPQGVALKVGGLVVRVWRSC